MLKVFDRTSNLKSAFAAPFIWSVRKRKGGALRWKENIACHGYEDAQHCPASGEPGILVGSRRGGSWGPAFDNQSTITPTPGQTQPHVSGLFLHVQIGS